MAGKGIKLTKKLKGREEKVEYRHFGSNDDAIVECIKESDWLKTEGYRAMPHKFLCTYVDESEKGVTSTKPKVDNKGKNILSITSMTDDAMSHRSRNTSPAHSDRSYMDDEDNSFADTHTTLGPPISGCIKVLLAEHYKEDTDPKGWIMS